MRAFLVLLGFKAFLSVSERFWPGRLHTRPFLSPLEKRWLAFQLLQALKQCHALDICHGDIKTENILLTSWDWCALTKEKGMQGSIRQRLHASL